MNIFVTGGCGYKGSVLVPMLLEKGHNLTVCDTQWFGNYLEAHERLTVMKEDIRNIELSVFKEPFDVIIHLASVANDPCSDLNPELTWEISALATRHLADQAVRNGVKQFIYASSGSVYGIKEELQVVEDLPLTPISIYNKAKMVAERVLLSYADSMCVQIVRPATVCGYSPRMRLDVSVNMLTMQALVNQRITVFGGKQIRPNIHIEDIASLYIHLLENPSIHGIFNAGFENISILDIAEMVSTIIPSDIEVTESNDPRSYRINSDKILKTGFVPQKSVKSAILEIHDKFNNKILENLPQYYNLKWMKQNQL